MAPGSLQIKHGISQIALVKAGGSQIIKNVGSAEAVRQEFQVFLLRSRIILAVVGFPRSIEDLLRLLRREVILNQYRNHKQRNHFVVFHPTNSSWACSRTQFPWPPSPPGAKRPRSQASRIRRMRSCWSSARCACARRSLSKLRVSPVTGTPNFTSKKSRSAFSTSA